MDNKKQLEETLKLFNDSMKTLLKSSFQFDEEFKLKKKELEDAKEKSRELTKLLKRLSEMN